MVHSYRIILAFTLILYNLNVFSQEKTFEGEIVYSFYFKDKTGKMNDSQSKKIMGTEQSYLFKNNKYKSEMNGEMNFTQFYHGNDRLYFSMNNSNSVFYTDCSVPDDMILSYEIKKVNKNISGYVCDLLVVNSEMGVTYYYFSQQFKTNFLFFKNHKKGLWSFFLEKTGGCLPIKIVADYNISKMEISVKNIDKKKLEDFHFEIPKGLPLIKANN